MPKDSLPPYRNTIAKASSLLTGPDGYRYRFTITDEIVHPQTGMPEKLLCLQRIKFEDSQPEIRLGYYIISKKPKMRGKWVCGQYYTFMLLRDFKALIRRAEKKG